MKLKSNNYVPYDVDEGDSIGCALANPNTKLISRIWLSPSSGIVGTTRHGSASFSAFMK